MYSTIKFAALGLVTAALCHTGLAQAAENPSPSGDPFIGSYEGTYAPTGYEPFSATGQVVSEGPELYRIHVEFAVGTKGNLQHSQLELHGRARGNRLAFGSYSGSVEWKVALEDGHLKIYRDYEGYGGVFDLNKVIHVSPTEGLAAPKNAVLLLPYTPGQKADMSAWTSTKWEALDDGVMQVKGRTESNKTKQSFGDFKMHLEFKTAHMPKEQAQGRSNSGVYFQDRYEMQVLDSFGLVPGSGDCGGIYQQAMPIVNASFPPGQWQTYDVVYHAPRFDKEGKVKAFPRITVKHNGVLIHDNHVFKTVTGGAASDKHVAKAPIRLQDHGDPVQYRNIWIVEK